MDALAIKAFTRGHFVSLSFGLLCGGMLFISCDKVVGDYGGFMRKAATTMYHVRRQKHRQYRRILVGIERTDIFKHLETRDFKALSHSIQSREYKKGDMIYQAGDPATELFILISGHVQLLRDGDKATGSRDIGENQAFGRLAFVTGSPHGSGAMAASDATVLAVPRAAFNALVMNSSTLQQVMHRWLRGTELLNYLVDEHRLAEEQARSWTDNAVQSLISRGEIPPAVEPDHQARAFMEIASDIGGLTLFRQLPTNELELICASLLFHPYTSGQTLFHQDEIADRLYIIKDGAITLLDAGSADRKSRSAGPGDAIGALSFITGARHVTSAIVSEATGAWALRMVRQCLYSRCGTVYVCPGGRYCSRRHADHDRPDHDAGGLLQGRLHCRLCHPARLYRGNHL
jgi:CRP-like cAMP-binding protein